MNACKSKKHADKLYYNAKVYTLDSAFSTANAFVTENGKVLEAGDYEELQNTYEAEKQTDLKSACVYPGFIDGHCHFTELAVNRFRYANLRDTRSWDEILERLEEHASEKSMNWICGYGWDQNDWPVKEYPDRDSLDSLFPDVPVYLTRIDQHAAVCNGKALQIAGINAETEVAGGQIILRNGEPSGVLIDNAMNLVKKHIPELSEEQMKEALVHAEKYCLERGLTGVVEAGLEKPLLDLLKKMYSKETLSVWMHAMILPTDVNIEAYMKQGHYLSEDFVVRSLKLFSDGALGSRGACLLEAYSDDPGNYGFLLQDTSFYRKYCKLAHQYDYQVCTHCIGDSAARIMLKLYAEFLEPENDRRWRIEHTQTIHDDDLKRFGDHGIIPSIQGTHATSDMYWAETRIGERIKTAYRFKDLLQQNGWLINGTDFPIEEVDPLLTFYTSVFRKDTQAWPEGGFQPGNALSREESLRSMTIWAAKGSFMEDTRGSLEPGKWADFVILDTDLMKAGEQDVLAARVLGTYIKDEALYQPNE